MTDQPGNEQGATGKTPDVASSELVVREPYRAVVPERRWPRAVVRTRAVLLRLRENPAAVASVSAAATLAVPLVTAGLRRALGAGGLPATRSVVVQGHIVHEVHVVHHVVHHVVQHVARPPAR
jgi:hypothetical protein